MKCQIEWGFIGTFVVNCQDNDNVTYPIVKNDPFVMLSGIPLHRFSNLSKPTHQTSHIPTKYII